MRYQRPVLFILLAILGFVTLLLNVWEATWITKTQSSSFSTTPTRTHQFSITPEQCQKYAASPTNYNYDSVVEANISTILNQRNITPILYHCGGYALNRNFRPVLLSILPEYTWVDLNEIDSKQFLNAFNYRESNQIDLFISNWRLNECKQQSIIQWVYLYFKGKILFLNPEDGTNFPPPLARPNIHYELGPGIPRSNRFPFTFLQAAFWAQLSTTQEKQYILNPSQRRQNNRRHLLIYAHSHCVGIRQAAFRKISQALYTNNPNHLVHYGGRCNGGIQTNNNNRTNIKWYPNQIRLHNWEENRNIYQNFQFCLTMEHVNAPGYITEKILVAFWAGCIPIYYGTNEIFQIFNEKSFVYYNISNPKLALNQIISLTNNVTLQKQMLQEPILVPNAEQDYFSLDQSIGNARLKNRIRSFLGVK